MSERVQKILAAAGLGSRRAVEKWIDEGRVSVNGRVVALGDRAESQDRICVDGRPVARRPLEIESRTLMYHKPEGVLATRSDVQGRATIFEDLPPLRNARWITVGRLDMNTSGLLLVTTDGELAHRLMHPSYEVEREYVVRVLGVVTEEIRQRLLAGVPVDGKPARFRALEERGGSGANHWYRVVLAEGRYREVRRLWEAVGAQVSRLKRVRFGPVTLPRDLRPGQSRAVDLQTLRQLREVARLEDTRPRRSGGRGRVAAVRRPSPGTARGQGPRKKRS